MKKYYAVRKGRNPGIYLTWDECKNEVNSFSGAEYKGFGTEKEAKEYLMGVSLQPESNSEAVAYVDGSFSLELSMFSYGALIFYNNQELEFMKSFDDPELVSMRNVAGEIMGAQFVMQFCIDNKIKTLNLYYDYNGIEKWCTGEWKTNTPGTKSYSEFYNKIKDNLSVNFKKVKGHSGDKYNELVDKLAKKALGIID